MKRYLSLILIIILTLCTITPTMAISENELYEQSALILKEIGVLKELRLEANLKRQDMVVLISRLYKEEEVAKNYIDKHQFKDIKDKNYDSYIAWAVNKGLIQGFSKNIFGYDKTVTVQEFQTVLLRALDYKEESSNWSKIPDIAESLNLMEGISTQPKQELSRGLMATMTVNALKHTLRGSSMTLAQKLNIDISNPFKIAANTIVNKDTLKLEGTAIGTKSLILEVKLIDNNSSTEEKLYELEINSDGKFSIEISNLKSGKYEYKFIFGNLYTTPETFTIQDTNINKNPEIL